METCARCGTELKWNERRMVFWNSQLKKGYIKWYVMGSPLMGRVKEFPEYKGKKLCQICAYEVFTGEVYARPRKTEKGNQNSEEKGAEPKGELIIADFAALRLALSKSGVVMSAFNCPKCSGMVDIPESGKLLICKHCGNPIKPAEIYEKIKSLI